MSTPSINLEIATALGISPRTLLVSATHWSNDPVLVAAFNRSDSYTNLWISAELADSLNLPFALVLAAAPHWRKNPIISEAKRTKAAAQAAATAEFVTKVRKAAIEAAAPEERMNMSDPANWEGPYYLKRV